MADQNRSKLISLRPLQLTSPKLSQSSSTLSPMTDLALNLTSLTTGYVATPKRRISFSSCGTPTPGRRVLTPSLSDNGCQDSCLTDSPLLQESYVKQKAKQKFLRQRSLTVCSSPTFDKENIPEIHYTNSGLYGDLVDEQDTTSQDGGYSGGIPLLDKDCGHYKDDFVFTQPTCLPPRKPRSQDLDSPRKPLPATTDATLEIGKQPVELRNTDKTRSVRPASEPTGDSNDGFLDLCFLDTDDETQLPSGFTDLLQMPLSFKTNKRQLGSPTSRDARVSCLTEVNRQPQAPTYTRNLFSSYGNARSTFKRPDPPLRDTPTKQQNKRRKATSFCMQQHSILKQDVENVEPFVQQKMVLQRCFSETEATIKRALQRSVQFPDLIGDFSKSFSLPLVVGRHEDLKTVTAETVVRLVRGEFDSEVEQHVIVDCRYPYEYAAGHIQGARNIYSKEGILKEFLQNLVTVKDGSKRLVLIFHCEFSSERGPSLFRFLRNKDREANTDCYPALHYPEIYLLNGGYKAFFELCKEFCEPQAYKTMLHKDHEDDLKRFRAKSKSWSGETKGRVAMRPGSKGVKSLSQK